VEVDRALGWLKTVITISEKIADFSKKLDRHDEHLLDHERRLTRLETAMQLAMQGRLRLPDGSA
jgi:hypothetical protein